MLSIAQIKPGVAITIDGEPYIVTKSEFGKQARQGGVTKATLKNLKTGANIYKSFSGNDKVERADLERARCQYLYNDGNYFHFMHKDTFEQFEITEEFVSDNKYYLLEGGDCDILLFEGQPIGIEVAPKVVLKVIETPPGVKGDTAQGGTKPAKLETGLTVSVPLFIEEGESIRVNTEEGTYVERAN